ncbi:MAG TPA: TolC family protein [Candidatus Binataceae bacterium]|nr:TolC family protein [Candidatus Binataceae bacterium]
MKRFNLIAAALGLVTALASTAIGAPILTLQRSIDEAVAHSPGLSAYRHLVQAAREDITVKRGSTLPYLSSNLQLYEVNGFPAAPYTTLHLVIPENGFGAAAIVHNPNAHWAPVAIQEVGVNYPLYKEGSVMGLNNPPVVAAARAVLTEQELLSILQAQKLILDVTQAYVNAASFRDQSDLQDQIVALHEKQLKIVRAEVSLGLALPMQIDIVRAQLEAARKIQVAARQSMNSYCTLLSTLMGRGSDYAFALDHTKLPLPTLPSLQEFLGRVMPVHPALRVQGTKIEVAQQEVKIEQANLLPTAELHTKFAGAEDLDYFNGNEAHRRPTEFQAYITVSIPLWDFGQRRAASREAQDKLLYEKDSHEQLDLQIRSAITTVYGRIDDYARNVAIAESAYLRDQQDLMLARAQRRQGVIDELQLVMTQVAQANAEVSVEGATQLERLEYADLQNLAGGAWQWIRQTIN